MKRNKQWMACLVAGCVAGLAGLAGAADDPEIGSAGEWEGIELAPGIRLGGLVEVEASYANQDGSETDLTVSTVELGLTAEPMEGVYGEVVVFWEQDEDVEIDAAFIELGGTEDIPVVLSAGRMYVPFGGFNSLMVSDPLTLELGETRETAVALAYDWAVFTFWAGAFSGELENVDDIQNAVGAVTFTPAEGFTFGVSMSTDIGEGAGYADDINDFLAEDGDYDRTVGVSAFALLEWNGFTLSAEYLGAVEDMKLTDAEGGVEAFRPQAWFVDLGYAFTEAWSAALRYEGSKEFKTDEMPEAQYGAAVAWQFTPFTTVAAEYLFGTFDAEDVDDRHQVTLKLAMEF